MTITSASSVDALHSRPSDQTRALERLGSARARVLELTGLLGLARDELSDAHREAHRAGLHDDDLLR